MARDRRSRLVLAATAALTMASLLTPALASPVARRARPAQSFRIAAEGGPYPFTWSWSPDDLTFRWRGKVTWENPSAEEHQVEFWDAPVPIDELVLAPGGTAALTLRRPGVYSYRCDIAAHSDIVYAGNERLCVGMCGEITVE